jgi:hypothetical protein
MGRSTRLDSLGASASISRAAGALWLENRVVEAMPVAFRAWDLTGWDRSLVATPAGFSERVRGVVETRAFAGAAEEASGALARSAPSVSGDGGLRKVSRAGGE